MSRGEKGQRVGRAVSARRPEGADGFLLRLMHDTQIAIIEALRVVDEPLSPAELEKVFGERTSLVNIAYHCRRLTELEVLRLVRTRPVRGAMEHFYFFRKDTDWLRDG